MLYRIIVNGQVCTSFNVNLRRKCTTSGETLFSLSDIDTEPFDLMIKLDIGFVSAQYSLKLTF
jgi:hypothetical protein